MRLFAGLIMLALGILLILWANGNISFGIPCVVGTKYASKILKDGDKVEVNANNGVVRKV